MSTWKGNLKKRYDEHRHCPVCGISIPTDKEYCSLECSDKYRGMEKKQSRSQWITMGMMVVVLIFTMVIMPMFGGG